MTANPPHGIYVHPAALCESDEVGAGTRVWAFAHVMQGARVGADCNVGEGSFLEAGSVLGDRVTVKNHVLIWNGVVVADEAFIGPCVLFTNDRFPRSPRMRLPVVAERYESADRWLERTHVDRGASLGAGAVILPGLSIGAYAVVGAAALVTRNVSAHRLVVGQPARPAGWACRCGQRLDTGFACRACGQRYARRDETLEPLS